MPDEIRRIKRDIRQPTNFVAWDIFRDNPRREIGGRSITAAITRRLVAEVDGGLEKSARE